MSQLTNALLDWNTDLDDIMTNLKKDPTSRRHSAPISLPSRQNTKRVVQFGKVQIRDCERILGDNPACEIGPSLSLGWKYNIRKSMKVDQWEQQKQQRWERLERERRKPPPPPSQNKGSSRSLLSKKKSQHSPVVAPASPPKTRRSSRDFYLSEERRVALAKEVAGIALKDITRNIELISYFHQERNETVMQFHKERAALQLKEGSALVLNKQQHQARFSKLNTTYLSC